MALATSMYGCAAQPAPAENQQSVETEQILTHPKKPGQSTFSPYDEQVRAELDKHLTYNYVRGLELIDLDTVTMYGTGTTAMNVGDENRFVIRPLITLGKRAGNLKITAHGGATWKMEVLYDSKDLPMYRIGFLDPPVSTWSYRVAWDKGNILVRAWAPSGELPNITWEFTEDGPRGLPPTSSSWIPPTPTGQSN